MTHPVGLPPPGPSPRPAPPAPDTNLLPALAWTLGLTTLGAVLVAVVMTAGVATILVVLVALLGWFASQFDPDQSAGSAVRDLDVGSRVLHWWVDHALEAGLVLLACLVGAVAALLAMRLVAGVRRWAALLQALAAVGSVYLLVSLVAYGVNLVVGRGA